jgi:hypothetical protein
VEQVFFFCIRDRDRDKDRRQNRDNDRDRDNDGKKSDDRSKESETHPLLMPLCISLHHTHVFFSRLDEKVKVAMFGPQHGSTALNSATLLANPQFKVQPIFMI